MALKKRKRFNEGGLSDKEAGLEASKDDKVGFFERLRMGNIDDESSEAYKRFGAGRGRASRVPVETITPNSASQSTAEAPAAPNRKKLYENGLPSHDSGASRVRNALESATENSLNKKELGFKNEGGKYDTALPTDAGSSLGQLAPPKQPKPGGRPHVNVATASKPEPSKSPAKQGQSYRRTEGATAEGTAKAEPFVSNKYPESRGSVKDSEAAEVRRRVREGDQAIERVTPETSLLPGGGLKGLGAVAKKLATPKPAKLKNYDQPALPAPSRVADKALPSPTKRIGFDKRSAFEKKRAERAAKRREEMLDENAKNYGLDPKAPGYESASGAVRREMGGKDFTFKKGGRIKPMAKKMASGGAVSGASKRGDGIATRGKTNCKMR
jgi:hypothetical protein